MGIHQDLQASPKPSTQMRFDHRRLNNNDRTLFGVCVCVRVHTFLQKKLLLSGTPVTFCIIPLQTKVTSTPESKTVSLDITGRVYC